MQHQWKSFKPKDNGISIGTLFYIAIDYGYQKTVDIDGLFSNVSSNNSPVLNNKPFSWTGGYIVNNKEMNAIEDPKWIYKDLIIQGHVIAIVAEPNGGKTTLLAHLAGDMVNTGYDVTYVNADIAASDAKAMHQQSQNNGWTLLLPDMKVGLSMGTVVDELEKMNQIEYDYSNHVMVFDTLKKMTDIISKNKSKALYKVLRGLSAKGMTVILLAHTNKYKADDGSPIFEGTGDLRSDMDELIYLIPDKKADGSMTISTKPDKVRGSFKPISFEISKNREVTALNDYIDTASLRTEKHQLKKDSTVIELITSSIRAGTNKQIEIIDYCKNKGVGWRQVKKVLKSHQLGEAILPLWETITGDKNALVYSLIGEPSIDGLFECVL